MSAVATAVRSFESETGNLPGCVHGSIISAAHRTSGRSPGSEISTSFQNWRAVLGSLLPSNVDTGKEGIPTTEDESVSKASGQQSEPPAHPDRQSAIEQPMPANPGASSGRLLSRLCDGRPVRWNEHRFMGSGVASHPGPKMSKAGGHLLTHVREFKSSQHPRGAAFEITSSAISGISASSDVTPFRGLNPSVVLPGEQTLPDGNRAVHTKGDAENATQRTAAPASDQRSVPAAQKFDPELPAATALPARGDETVPSPQPQPNEESGIDSSPVPQRPVTEQLSLHPVLSERDEGIARFDPKPKNVVAPASSNDSTGTNGGLTSSHGGNRQFPSVPIPTRVEGRFSVVPHRAFPPVEQDVPLYTGISAGRAISSASHPGSANVSVSMLHEAVNPHTSFAGPFTVSIGLLGIGPEGQPVRTIPTAQEPFAMIDTIPVHAGAGWTLAGTHRAEAGFQDPALGWVAVRAQEVGGTIHATIVPAASEGVQALSDHLPALIAHMASQSPHLDTISISTSDATTGWGRNDGQGQGPHQQHQEQKPPDDERADRIPFSTESASARATDRGAPGGIATIASTEHRVSIRV